MKSNLFIRIFIALIVVVFFGHQFYSSVYKPISTESVVYHEMTDGIHITGLIMRHESLVTGNTKGVYHYLINDGNRVAKNGVIANIYDSDKASKTMSELESVNAQLADLTELKHYGEQNSVDLEWINNRVEDSFDQMVRKNATGNFEFATEQADTLLHQMNRRQVVTGQLTDFSARISALKKERDQLKADLPSAKGRIKAKTSGYFSTTTDGYENAIKGKKLTDYTVEFLDGLKPQPIDENVVGKIVSDYDWYVFAKMSLNDSMRYKVGDVLSLTTETRINQTLEVTVAQINVSEKKGSAVVVLSCSQMSRELASMRSGAMKIVQKTYAGLKVPKKALRVVNGQRGVYVLSGITLHFVPVSIVYANNQYLICEQQKSNESVLRLYDNVVVKGKNLYDGKVVT